MTLTQVDDEAMWSAIAEPSRRQILDMLLTRGEATPTSLAAELPLTRQAVAKHLNVLSRTGMVESARHGREVRYRVRPEQIDAAAAALAKVAARWEKRLATIKAMAEAAHRSQESTTEAPEHQRPPAHREKPYQRE
ncbi:MAG TPA: metalloregulator ArsR/SmtB family transcription factor [Candidatus Dormibacteraeota bacterium]|nr:metalloregulator ArsR/SmtB family transcription factor [Candidatus Dormibacteraeota bacterium]